MSKSERLKQARIKAGFKRATLAAAYLRVPYGTYSGHEAGSRGIRDDELQHYATSFKVPVYWLAFGDTPLNAKIKIVGSTGAQVKNFKDGSRIIEVNAPFPIANDRWIRANGFKGLSGPDRTECGIWRISTMPRCISSRRANFAGQIIINWHQ